MRKVADAVPRAPLEFADVERLEAIAAHGRLSRATRVAADREEFDRMRRRRCAGGTSTCRRETAPRRRAEGQAACRPLRRWRRSPPRAAGSRRWSRARRATRASTSTRSSGRTEAGKMQRARTNSIRTGGMRSPAIFASGGSSKKARIEAAGTRRHPRCSALAGRSQQTIYRDSGLGFPNYPAYPAATITIGETPCPAQT